MKLNHPTRVSRQTRPCLSWLRSEPCNTAPPLRGTDIRRNATTCKRHHVPPRARLTSTQPTCYAAPAMDESAEIQERLQLKRDGERRAYADMAAVLQQPGMTIKKAGLYVATMLEVVAALANEKR